jgi:hypothetical protein
MFPVCLVPFATNRADPPPRRDGDTDSPNKNGAMPPWKSNKAARSRPARDRGLFDRLGSYRPVVPAARSGTCARRRCDVRTRRPDRLAHASVGSDADRAISRLTVRQHGCRHSWSDRIRRTARGLEASSAGPPSAPLAMPRVGFPTRPNWAEPRCRARAPPTTRVRQRWRVHADRVLWAAPATPIRSIALSRTLSARRPVTNAAALMAAGRGGACHFTEKFDQSERFN